MLNPSTTAHLIFYLNKVSTIKYIFSVGPRFENSPDLEWVDLTAVCLITACLTGLHWLLSLKEV